MTRLLLGSEVVAVSAWQERYTPPNPRGEEFTDPGGSVLLEFENGARAFWEVNAGTRQLPALTITGELGMIELAEVGGPWIARRQREAGGALLPMPFPTEHVVDHVPIDLIDLTTRFYRDLVGDGPLAVGPRDGLAVVEIILALHESQRLGGARVPLPLTGPARSRDVPIT